MSKSPRRKIADPQLDELLAFLPIDDTSKEQLLMHFEQPSRQYHDLRHLADLWSCHRTHARAGGFDHPDCHCRIACAVAYHDAILDGYRRDNEARSSRYWLSVAERCRIDQGDARWVADTILATADHLGYAPHAQAQASSEALKIWFLDLDLTPLAIEPRRFAENTRKLRREARHLSDQEWYTSLAGFFAKMAGAPRIYRSPVMFARYEDAARRNIKAARDDLAEKHGIA